MASLVESGIEIRWAMQAIQHAIASGVGEILVKGPRGTGKTIYHSYLFHDFCLRYPGMVQVWTRSDRSRLTDAVLKTFEEEVLGTSHPLIIGKSRESRHSYQYPNGSKIILQGLDDPERQKSVGADLVWVNEPTEILESQWEELGASLRPTLGSRCPFRLLIGDHNPHPPSHWTNTRCKPFPVKLYPRIKGDGLDMPQCFTPEMYRATAEYNFSDQSKFKTHAIQTFHPDNPGYWDAQAWDWWPNGKEYVRQRLGKYSGGRKGRYLEGRPMADEATVFGSSFDREKHVIDPFPNGWPSDWPVTIGYDPGFAHPCAVVFWGVAPNGSHYIIDEIHGSEIPLKVLGPEIKEKAAKYRIVKWLDDPRGANQRRQESNGKTVRDIMRDDHRLFFSPWQAAEGKGKQAQVEAIRNILLEDKLQIFNTCTGVIGEFESWKNAVNTKGELKAGDDAYEDRSNDAMDAVMGIVASNPQFEVSKIGVYNNP